jgi:SnoaL-like domain
MTSFEEMQDRLAICELKARYCRFMDTKQWDAWRELFTEDYVLDVSAAGGGPPIHGRDAAMVSVLSSIGQAVTAHQVHFPEITLNGDEASAIFPMQDRVIFASERPSITGYGHYHDRLVRRNGEWKIASLKLTRLHTDVHPAKPAQ